MLVSFLDLDLHVDQGDDPLVDLPVDDHVGSLATDLVVMVRHPAGLDVVEERGPWRADVMISVVRACPDPCGLHLLTLLDAEVDWSLHLDWSYDLLVREHTTENVDLALESSTPKCQECAL